MKLSILICHLYSRREKLMRLHRRLVEECVDTSALLTSRIDWENMYWAFIQTGRMEFKNGVEVLVECDPIISKSDASSGAIHGSMSEQEKAKWISIGAKRNRLLAKASAPYCMYVDDDDLLSTGAVDRILDVLKFNPDVVGIAGQLIRRGEETKKFIHSISIPHWFENNKIYFRNPNHLNPVRRELALKVGFSEINHGEDKKYSDEIAPLLKSESFILENTYEYMKD